MGSKGVFRKAFPGARVTTSRCIVRVKLPFSTRTPRPQQTRQIISFKKVQGDAVEDKSVHADTLFDGETGRRWSDYSSSDESVA